MKKPSLLIIFLTVFIDLIGFGIVMPLLPLYSDGKHVQHWPNHDNHIHVRVSEEAYGDTRILVDAPFEAP